MMKRLYLTLATIVLFQGISATSAGAADDASTDDGNPENTLVMPTIADYPTLKKMASKPMDFVPRGWTVLGKATGDLNGDGLPDYAIAVKGTAKKFIQNNSEMMVVDYNSNPRLLLIAFARPETNKKVTYRLAAKSKAFMPIPETNMEEPFEKLVIKHGVLSVKIAYAYTAGSWTNTNMEYKFRYQNNDFYLIGAESNSYHRGNAESDNDSFNLLTNRAILTHWNAQYPEMGKKIKRVKLQLKKLKKMSDFKVLNEWEIMYDQRL